ncbi:hypothetical protein ABT354_20150 [Streptomyces sp. NPDC000594]|uniref:hypothetical protein n=1 Tax=Streptomyces sp. NPDC000594 TaxID=3154261 RepID=UPI003321507E
MQLTTVTLPDGTAAVVHTDSTLWSDGDGRRGGRAALVQETLGLVSTEAAALGCAALRRAGTEAGSVSVETLDHGLLSATVRVLCTSAECRSLAEHCERAGEPDPSAPAARTWALAQMPADEEAMDMAWERTTAAVQDANLARLRSTDPDADLLFTEGCFTAYLADPRSGFDLGGALENYGAAKHAEGRMDRFYALFAGLDDVEEVSR